MSQLLNWRKIPLPPSHTDIQEPTIWQLELSEIYRESGRPQDFCIFLTVDQSGDRTVYFSPVAVEHCVQFFRDISNAHEFYECDPPIGGNLLVGSELFDCLRLLNRDS